MDEQKVFDYAYIELTDEYNRNIGELDWCIRKYYKSKEYEFNCMITPLKDKSKRKAIKELVALGGVRKRISSYSYLRIYFYDEITWNEAFEYIKSIELLYKLANGE